MNRPGSGEVDKGSLRLQVGGTLVPGRDIYITRPEDDQLFELLSAGEYVNILSSRQVGKSSLMLRAAFRLQERGWRFAVVDLTALGTPENARVYFRGLVGEIARQLRMQFDAAAFWRDDAHAGTHSQQFIRFFREVVATEIDAPVAIFLDEIDSTLKLPYTDDLFTAFRSMYNERAMVLAYQRIAICLVGVATPDELIKDRRTTPYNVGKTLWLGDFDAARDDLSPLVTALSGEAARGSALLDRVLYWTGGHPFLTTRLCQDLRAAGAEIPQDVDSFVGERYARLEGLGEDVHVQQVLRFVRERLTDGLASFNLYEHILKGEDERDQANLAHAELKLSGLVKRDRSGMLVIRNRIYARLFDLEWVRKSRPRQQLTRARWVAGGALVVLVAGVVFGGYYYRTDVVPLQQQYEARVELEKLKVTLTTDLRGFTEVHLPVQDRESALQRALPHLQRLGSGRESQALALKMSSAADVDLGTLAQLTTLRRLVISDPKFSDLGPIGALAGLHELDVSSTAVDDLAPLARLTGLKRLSADTTGVSDLAPVAKLENVEVLELGNTRVRDLTALAGLRRLRQLDVSNTSVQDVAPLAKLDLLEELDLSRTGVKDVAPLKSLPALRHLALDGLGIRAIRLEGREVQVSVLLDPPASPAGGAYRPGDSFRDCQECPQLVVVPAGSFVMGSPEREQGRDSDEGPQHDVTLSKAIATAKYEVRFDEWALCVRDRACPAVPDAGFGRGARPVINVSWDDAKAYAAWLSKVSGKAYRLLSEAEWEYAARAGTDTAYPWGGEAGVNQANFNGSGSRWSGQQSAPVGSFAPSAFGLHDMIGNVWEWTEDCYHDSYREAPRDGKAWIDDRCPSRVLRGGSWFSFPHLARAANRSRDGPGNRLELLGFRVARTLP